MDERLRNFLDALKKENDPLRKALGVVAVLTEALEPEGIRPILVGGVALEFYTLGGYATKDIDLVASSREKLKTVLEMLGFTRRMGERHWYSTEFDVAIEIPDEILAGSPEKLTVVEIGGKNVYIIGVEDLIIDRLSAAKFWQSQSDLEWAVKILALHAEDIDFDYLKKAAQEHDVEDILKEAIKESEGLKALEEAQRPDI